LIAIAVSLRMAERNPPGALPYHQTVQYRVDALTSHVN
jgi:hypothetical protein